MGYVAASAVSKGRCVCVCVCVSVFVCNTHTHAVVGIAAFQEVEQLWLQHHLPEVLVAVYTGSTSLSLPANFHVMKHGVVGSAGC